MRLQASQRMASLKLINASEYILYIELYMYFNYECKLANIIILTYSLTSMSFFHTSEKNGVLPVMQSQGQKYFLGRTLPTN